MKTAPEISTKTATTIEEQIEILKNRGMMFDNENKAKEQLLDIGYYRLGFYCFPFEQSFPKTKNRTHEYVPGTKFQDVVDLYYFDSDLRQILTKYLTRIEINFRTSLTLTVSNQYREIPTWFVSPSVVLPPKKTAQEIEKEKNGSKPRSDIQRIRTDFRKKVYMRIKREEDIIKAHHKKYPGDTFAPAWKTMEFMTFGSIYYLYENLQNEQLKRILALKFGCNTTSLFLNYLETIKDIRNKCAHGACLFNINLSLSIRSGPIGLRCNQDTHNIYGAIQVIRYILGRVSINRLTLLDEDINSLLATKRAHSVSQIITNCSGIKKRDL